MLAHRRHGNALRGAKPCCNSRVHGEQLLLLECAGEHMHEFETFETGKFVSRLLGKGDWNSFIERVQVRCATRVPLGAALQ
jgi:signal recognition particle GTPase